MDIKILEDQGFVKDIYGDYHIDVPRIKKTLNINAREVAAIADADTHTFIKKLFSMHGQPYEIPEVVDAEEEKEIIEAVEEIEKGEETKDLEEVKKEIEEEEIA